MHREVISHPFKVLNVDESSPYPHRRKVEWLSKVRRSALPESMQRALRSSQAVFRIGGAGEWTESIVGSPCTLEKKDEWSDSRVPALVAAEPRDGYRIWLRYDDGVCGEVDLSGTPAQVYSRRGRTAPFSKRRISTNMARSSGARMNR